METRDVFCILALIGVLGTLHSDACNQDTDCGSKATCTNQTICSCPQGLTLHSDGKSCRNVSCSSGDCLECVVAPSVCSRCVSFMSSSSGLCLSKCEGSAERKGTNIMCTEKEENDSDDDRDVDIVVAVVAGVGAGTLLCILIIVIVCVYLRKTRKKINLQNHSYRNGQMEIGHVKQYPAFDNSAFETDSQVDYRPGKIDPLQYMNELELLRPHTDTLMTLLSQVKAKTRAMNSSDPRVSTYKGVIHQLCRVLVLLHKKDPVVSIPSDALSLLQWAQQMLDDHREQQSSSGGTAEYPIARISAVDDDGLGNPTSPVYATPNDNSFGQPQSSPLSQRLANPYSTVPVPIPSKDDSRQQHRSSRNSGYATIRRTPSIPNGEILKAMEDGGLTTTHPHHHQLHQLHNPYDGYDDSPVTEIEPVNVSSFSSPHQGAAFSSFLINNGKTSSDDNSTVERKKTNTEDLRRLSQRREPPPEIFNTSSESYGDIDFSGGYHTQTPKSGQATPNTNVHQHITSGYEDNSDEVVLRNKDKSIKSATPVLVNNAGGGGGSGTPPIKKNIITNPNAIKKPSVSQKPSIPKKPSTVSNMANRNSNSNSSSGVKSASGVGYFANGHFYDPNPSPALPEPDSEVYAPGSSYSGRSNVMSTFLGDLPQSRSVSESDQSEDGNAESDNSGGDLDVFPFDLKEATNPVEV